MIYHAKTQQAHLAFLLGLIALTPGVNSNELGIFYFKLVFVILFFVSFFLNFQFTINEDHLIYQIFLFKIPIYQKAIEPNQINHIKFKRVGWAKKGAIIKTKKGFNIRIILFEPEDVYTNLNDFADQNCIKVLKTKDYLILEKYKI